MSRYERMTRQQAHPRPHGARIGGRGNEYARAVAADRTSCAPAPSGPSDPVESTGARRRLQKGSQLARPGDTGRRLYVVESGLIEVFLRKVGGHFPIASFHAGACFFCDFNGTRLVQGVAAEASVVRDLPLDAFDRLDRQGIELRTLLLRCRPFDLQAFVAACYGG